MMESVAAVSIFSSDGSIIGRLITYTNEECIQYPVGTTYNTLILWSNLI